ncbi:MAG: TRAP transporter substrate-binding protein [Betaproteobacteria bacterium]|nr:TRAP transporter substrate-binding protein [Betaproteobacteria bacterium]MCC7217399.1 TRAP transporter substrate-binding protein [Burkholderiales bacterium]
MRTAKPVVLAAAVALALGAVPARAQDVVLKIHHFLPPQATIQAQVFNPWCEKVGRESGGRIKCQIYPSMQLGGTPPQLFDQAKDGVADIVWTLPTYQAGRFAKSEVFELPFMARNAETGSPALYEFVQKNSLDEFRGVKVLALHLHDGSLLHFTKQRVTNADELKGLKVRAPTRIGTKFLTAIGAVPVQMPVPQVTESLSKGVIDGAMVPWEVAPALKLQEVTKYHVDTAPGLPRMSNSIFVVAMNEAKYASLPPDVKKVIDANTGLAWSKQIGKVFDGTTAPGRKLAVDAGGVFDTLTQAEYDRWVRLTEGVNKDWFTEVGAKGANGPALLDDARALIKKNGG